MAGRWRLIREGRARALDILFVPRARLDRLTADRLSAPADLVVKVASYDSLARDWAEKFYPLDRAAGFLAARRGAAGD